VRVRRRQEGGKEQWRFDVDDMPPMGPDGAEEHDRHLIDDYDTGYVSFLQYISRKKLNGMQVFEALYDPAH
jgi:hypothetical protein